MPITVYTTATKGGAVAGYAVQTMTKQGFSGVVRLMVGFTPRRNIIAGAVETGLGTKIADEGQPSC